MQRLLFLFTRILLSLIFLTVFSWLIVLVPEWSILSLICAFFYYLGGVVMRRRLKKHLCDMGDCMERIN